MESRFRDVEFRAMITDDLTSTCALVEQFDPTLVSEARACFEQDLADLAGWPDQRFRLVALHGAQVVATMGYGRGGLPSANIRWTDWLVVDTTWRRRGLASELYRRLEEQLRQINCRRIYLDVGTVHRQPDAIGFHSFHGYRIEGILQDYWGVGSDLVIMAKTLEGSR